MVSKRPDLAEEWDYEKNKEILPDSITLYSNKKDGGNVKDVVNRGMYLLRNEHTDRNVNVNQIRDQ